MALDQLASSLTGRQLLHIIDTLLGVGEYVDLLGDAVKTKKGYCLAQPAIVVHQLEELDVIFLNKRMLQKTYIGLDDLLLSVLHRPPVHVSQVVRDEQIPYEVVRKAYLRCSGLISEKSSLGLKMESALIMIVTALQSAMASL